MIGLLFCDFSTPKVWLIGCWEKPFCSHRGY